MPHRITALLVHHNSEICVTLKAALEHQGSRVAQADLRAQARHVLRVQKPALLVFTDTRLSDGTWADIVALEGQATLSVNVIVVAHTVNTRLYVETVAFDFIVPPFDALGLAHLVRCAVDNAIVRRAALPPALHGA